MTTTIAIGINTGPMVAGNMGSEEVKTDYTVIGDTVNTSAWFMTSAKGGQVMIGESTYALVKDYVTVAALPPLQVKGKIEPLTVYEVTGLTAAAAR
jgi:adenylate cyclase